MVRHVSAPAFDAMTELASTLPKDSPLRAALGALSNTAAAAEALRQTSGTRTRSRAMSEKNTRTATIA